jgi:hypothetical protein
MKVNFSGKYFRQQDSCLVAVWNLLFSVFHNYYWFLTTLTHQLLIRVAKMFPFPQYKATNHSVFNYIFWFLRILNQHGSKRLCIVLIQLYCTTGCLPLGEVHTLQISENRVTRKTFWSKKEGLFRNLEHFICSNFMISTHYQILLRYWNIWRYIGLAVWIRRGRLGRYFNTFIEIKETGIKVTHTNTQKRSYAKILRNHSNTYLCRSRDSAVGTATDYGLDDREVGVRIPVGPRIFTFPCRLDRLWGPPLLLYNGYRGRLPGGSCV